MRMELKPFHNKKKNNVASLLDLYGAILNMLNRWGWTTEPYLRFLCVSGTKRLAVKDADRARMIIESPEYQRFWGDKTTLRKDSNSKLLFHNTLHGARASYSMGTSIRGEGAHFFIIDDDNIGLGVKRKDEQND